MHSLENAKENAVQLKIRTGREPQSRINSYKEAEDFRGVVNRPYSTEWACIAQPLGDKRDIDCSPPTKIEILKANKGLKNNRAPGIGNITAEVLHCIEWNTMAHTNFIDLVKALSSMYRLRHLKEYPSSL